MEIALAVLMIHNCLIFNAKLFSPSREMYLKKLIPNYSVSNFTINYKNSICYFLEMYS